MNRRSFLKRCGLIPFIGSLTAGVEVLKSGPPGWTVFPEKPKLTVAMLQKAKEKLRDEYNPWDNLGCKDCFRGCGQWDECMATLRKRAGTTFICKSRCNCFGQRLMVCNGRIIVGCPNHKPYYVNSDGSTETIE